MNEQYVQQARQVVTFNAGWLEFARQDRVHGQECAYVKIAGLFLMQAPVEGQKEEKDCSRGYANELRAP